MRGRFAPSPTGAMHLGNARTALLAWLAARRAGGAVVLRIEDLDRARVQADGEARLLEDLRWLGLGWDEGPDLGGPHAPYRQSERTHLYDAALGALLGEGRAFLCACSRADVLRASSAPHDGDPEGPRYPGTCRDRAAGDVEAAASAAGRRPVIRFRGGERRGFTDGVCGEVTPAEIDDFVLRRADGVAAYQLAVVVDDAAMAVDLVVRGDDLLRSTPRQLALYRALGLRAPAFAHVPLVLSPDGERLAKRTRPISLADLRRAGVRPGRVTAALAASAGLCEPGDDVAPGALVDGFTFDRVPRVPVVIPPLI